VQLYLDCDGVLANFDRAATELLAMPPRAFEKRRGIGAFWRELARRPDFYGTLPLMPDAMRLFEAGRHLDPIILTGLPRGKWAAPQKVGWAGEYFPGTRILTVMAVDKRNHALEGDILVDDQLKRAHLWKGAGGVFVHHHDAASTIARLAELGVPVRDAGPMRSSEPIRSEGARG
jgi:hypothetical protein